MLRTQRESKLKTQSEAFSHDPITFDQKGLVVQSKSYHQYESLNKMICDTAFQPDQTKHLVVRKTDGYATIKEGNLSVDQIQNDQPNNSKVWLKIGEIDPAVDGDEDK